MNWNWLDADWLYTDWAPWAEGAAVAIAVAALAWWRDRRRTRRTNPDAVGLVAWDTVFVLAVFAAVLLIVLAWRNA